MKCNALIERFDSIHQMMNAIESRHENIVFNGSISWAKKADKDFTRTDTYEEAIDLISNGWSEPLEEIKRGTANNFKSNQTVNKTRPQTGVVGYAPCVPNAIMGLPNSMIMTEKTPSKVKAVTILFSMSVTGNIDNDKILKAGILILNIINDLEFAGFRVKLDVEFFGAAESSTIRTGSDICSARVTVKDWRQPLDLKKLAFPISHPSMFRRFGFRWVETFPKLTNTNYRGGYGSSHFKSNYQKTLATFKDSGMLDKNEYLITTYLCMNKGYDKDAVMKECGLANDTKKGVA